MNDLFQFLTERSAWLVRGENIPTTAAVTPTADGLVQKNDGYEIRSTYQKDAAGVYDLTGTLQNISSLPLTVSALSTAFSLDSDDLEVYTQFNGWQNESMGGWQPLVTGVFAKTKGLRSAYGAAPMLALWSRGTNRGIVFHLMPEFSWEMSVSYAPDGLEPRRAEVKIGISGEDLALPLAPGETVALPRILCYEFYNKTDLDCHKLHAYFGRRYPRRELPVIYNTWLARFDRITYENIADQIAPAAELGVEYFVIDAGWFGKGDSWVSSRGDWEERPNGKLGGHLKELAEQVRAAGMKFGLWFEIESAHPSADTVQNHPEYFFSDGDLRYYDFTNKEAADALFEVLSARIRDYGIEFLKLDFNQDSVTDATRTAYFNYFRGYRAFIRRLKEAFPDLYLENCASGGMRMDLANLTDFDSYWLSDNQSPYEGIRMVKEGILRLPPQAIERWACLYSANRSVGQVNTGETDQIIAAHDGLWDNAISVQPSYLNGFMYGGVYGISCDLTALSDGAKEALREGIALFKKDRAFLMTATCRILCDTDPLLVFEYASEDLGEARLVVIRGKMRVASVTVYPVVDREKTYTVGDETRSGADLAENGITLPVSGNFRADIVTIKEK